MNQINRLTGGLIDRSQPYSFSFDGKMMMGYSGDTLASALLANNVRLMGRSFKYHRPRGPLSAGSEEPNALVELREGARKEPNTRATTAELFDCLAARSQNRWPSLRFDAMAINDLFPNLFAAGFYYKTFMWPAAFWEKVYEPIIRKAAGLGSLSKEDDPDVYDKGFLHCDILIIGSGPAGLTAALTAGRSGAQVIIADEDFLMGGRLNAETFDVGGQAAHIWAADTIDELRAMQNVRIMPRTTVIGAFDHGIYGAVERVSDHLAVPAEGKPRQRLWRIYSKKAILAAGAIERMIAFEMNDRPGIMLASALRTYANRWAVTPAQNVAIFTNNDDGHRTAQDLQSKGVQIAAVIDTRLDAPKSNAYEVLPAATVTHTKGRLGLKSIQVTLQNGERRNINCGALGVSGGWNPNVSLSCHQRGRPVWNKRIASFVPSGDLPVGLRIAGAANGDFSTAGALRNGAGIASDTLHDLGYKPKLPDLPRAEDDPFNITAFWHVSTAKRAWLDQQNDVTTKDIAVAHQENFTAAEHLKRYTTLGMATDQGKTSNLGGLAIMAELTGKTIPEVGTTIFRPPYTATAFGPFVGRARNKALKPIRNTPSYIWAKEQGAVFVEAGLWLRAQWFAQKGETHWRETVDREVLQTRQSVGICDVSSLGKIDVQGSDAASFLNKIYCNPFAKVAVGKTRYGLMLREDGIVMDDGTAARLADDHFVVTTTTANAAGVYRHMEFVHQCLYPDMNVQLISTTEAWAQFSVAGPNSRKLLQKLVDPKHDISNESFPYMACANITICGGLRARLFRISFSGELAYEIAVPSRYGDALIRKLMDVGKEFDAIAYGVEALGVMRIEKGHPVGNELNGTTTALNLGMGRMVSDKKESIGSVLSKREGLNRDDALKLVGLKSQKPNQPITAGGHLMTKGTPVNAQHDQGYVTSACYSPMLGCHIALGLLKSGDKRKGEMIHLASPLTGVSCDVEVVSPHFYDPEGKRLHA